MTTMTIMETMMTKWLLFFLLLLVAFWAGNKYGSAKATAHATALADTVSAIRDTAATQRLALVRQQGVIDSLDRRADSLTAVGVRLKRLAGAARTRWDTVWANADTVPLAEIRRLGDAAIAACHQETTACEQREALAKETSDSLRVEVDSAKSHANTWSRAADASAREADEWKKVARGSLFNFYADGLLSAAGKWRADADFTVGKDRLKGLARFTVGTGAETCTVQSDYICTTPTVTELWFGAQFKF